MEGLENPSASAPAAKPEPAAAGTGHAPPPALAPVVIPPNTNPVPTSVTSPGTGSAITPGSSGGFVRRAAPEPNKRALYVGGLDPRVTEEVLRQIFETSGHILNVKIIPDKNVCFHCLGCADFSLQIKDRITALSSTTTQVQQNEPCRT